MRHQLSQRHNRPFLRSMSASGRRASQLRSVADMRHGIRELRHDLQFTPPRNFRPLAAHQLQAFVQPQRTVSCLQYHDKLHGVLVRSASTRHAINRIHERRSRRMLLSLGPGPALLFASLTPARKLHRHHTQGQLLAMRHQGLCVSFRTAHVAATGVPGIPLGLCVEIRMCM